MFRSFSSTERMCAICQVTSGVFSERLFTLVYERLWVLTLIGCSSSADFCTSLMSSTSPVDSKAPIPSVACRVGVAPTKPTAWPLTVLSSGSTTVSPARLIHGRTRFTTSFQPVTSNYEYFEKGAMLYEAEILLS